MVLKQRSLPSHVIQSPASEEQAGCAAPRRRVPPPPPPPPPPPRSGCPASSSSSSSSSVYSRSIKPVYSRANSTSSVASTIRSVVTAAPGSSSFAPVAAAPPPPITTTTTAAESVESRNDVSEYQAAMMRRRSTTILAGAVRESAVRSFRAQDRSCSMPATTAPAPAPAAETSRALSPSFFGNGGMGRQPFSPKSKIFFGNTDKSARDTSAGGAASTAGAQPRPSWCSASRGTLLLLCFSLYGVISTGTQLRQRNWELQQLRHDYHDLETSLQESENKLVDAEKNVQQLEKQLKIMETRTFYIQQEVRNKGADAISLEWFTYEGWKMPSTVQEEMTKKLIRRETALQENVERLQKHIQKISHREALERFGPGPHRVKFRVAFPEEQKLYDFVVELAPMDEMPHSVHHFLQMVAHQLWDGTIFLHGAHHVLQSSNNHSGQAKRDAFENAELTHLSFQEYSEAYPHEKYTLGFGGRPAGPEFYISTADNSVNHGPGGQRVHALHEQADPCFGRVVENTHIIDRMHQRSLQLKENEGTVTVIVDVRIL